MVVWECETKDIDALEERVLSFLGKRRLDANCERRRREGCVLAENNLSKAQ